MVTFLTGDMFGKKFMDEYRKFLDNVDYIDYEEIVPKEKTSDDFIKEFFEIEESEKFLPVHESIDPFRYQIAAQQILKLFALKNLRDKNVVLWHPLCTFNPYYVRKFSKELVNLVKSNNHSFTILTNDEIIFNEFRIAIINTQLNNNQVQIKYFWKNETCDIPLINGDYEFVPDHFCYEEYQKQLDEILTS